VSMCSRAQLAPMSESAGLAPEDVGQAARERAAKAITSTIRESRPVFKGVYLLSDAGFPPGGTPDARGVEVSNPSRKGCSSRSRPRPCEKIRPARKGLAAHARASRSRDGPPLAGAAPGGRRVRRGGGRLSRVRGGDEPGGAGGAALRPAGPAAGPHGKIPALSVGRREFSCGAPADDGPFDLAGRARSGTEPVHPRRVSLCLRLGAAL